MSRVRVALSVGLLATCFAWSDLLAQTPADSGPAAPTTERPFLADVRAALEDVASVRGIHVGFEVIDLATGERFGIRPREVFPSASLVKIPILVEAMAQVEAGDLALEDPLTFLDMDRAAGSGLLRHMTAPRDLTLSDALHLMIIVSDNSATDLVLEKVTPSAVNERMRQLGFASTRLLRPTVNSESDETPDPEAARVYGLGTTTPHEMAGLLTEMYRGDLISAEASRFMLGVLHEQLLGGGLDRYLPEEARVAHKTGNARGTANDCGIVDGPSRAFVICVMTRNDPTIPGLRSGSATEPRDIIGRLAALVYGSLNSATTEPSPSRSRER